MNYWNNLVELLGTVKRDILLWIIFWCTDLAKKLKSISRYDKRMQDMESCVIDILHNLNMTGTIKSSKAWNNNWNMLKDAKFWTVNKTKYW